MDRDLKHYRKSKAKLVKLAKALGVAIKSANESYWSRKSRTI